MKNLISRKSFTAVSILVSLNSQEVHLDPIVHKASEINEDLIINNNTQLIDSHSFINKGKTNVKDILNQSPSVHIRKNDIDMRGQGFSSRTSVKVMIDGIGLNPLDPYHGRVEFNTLSPDEIQSIEILPGGGAVLYGSGTRGGSINIITKTPTKDEIRASFQSGISNNNRIPLLVGLSMNQIFKNFIYTKAGINASRTYGSISGTTTEEYIGILQFGMLGEKSKLDLKSNLYGAHLVEGSIKKSTGKATLSANKDQKYDGLVAYTHQLNTTLISTKAYYRYNKFDYTGGFFLDDLFGIDIRAKIHYGGINNTQNATLKSNAILQDSQDQKNATIVQSNQNVSGSGEVLVGFEFNMQSSSTRTIKPKKFVNALFALNQHHFNPTFSLLTGARGEWDAYKVVRQALGSQNGLDVTTHRLHSAAELTPMIWISPTTKTYFKTEYGFISPAPMQLTNYTKSGNGGRIYKLNNLKPETYITLETGLMHHHDNTSTSLALFSTFSRDMIKMEGSPHSGSGISYINLNSTRHLGLELSLRHIWQYFNAGGSFSFVSPKITKGKNTGQYIENVPIMKATLELEAKPLPTLSIFTNLLFIGQQYFNNHQKQTKTKPYATCDLGLKYAQKQVSFNIGVKNLTNTSYRSYEDNSSYIPGDARNYYIQTNIVF